MEGPNDNTRCYGLMSWFFLFKQKTAYEMRISDWSSDVCSSDLPTILPPDYKGYAQAAIDAGIKIIETAGTQEVREIWEMVKPHGIKVLHKCTDRKSVV